MENIITNEDKKYLKKVLNYIRSLGMDYATINIEMHGYYTFNYIDWDMITDFDNKYGAEIPQGYVEILKKIFSNLDDSELDEFDYDNIDYNRIEIILNYNSKELSIIFEVGYTESDEGNGSSWDSDDDPEEVNRIFEVLSEFGHTDDQFNLSVRYDGGGDSGYLEDLFDDRSAVPDTIEQWCYNQLENLHGGWEINEGSSGDFEFSKEGDFKQITLTHYWNENKYESKTLFELELK
jgi:hypothetical protein